MRSTSRSLMGEVDSVLKKSLRSRRLRFASAPHAGERAPRLRTTAFYVRQGARECCIVIVHRNFNRIDEQNVRFAPTGPEDARKLTLISRPKLPISDGAQ
jgi:hypothetical protein